VHYFGVAAFTIADFNGDNKKDVLTANGYWLQGNGDGSFQPSEQRLNAILDQRNLAVGDFNGDKKNRTWQQHPCLTVATQPFRFLPATATAISRPAPAMPVCVAPTT
jgi:hypothetical protein